MPSNFTPFSGAQESHLQSAAGRISYRTLRRIGNGLLQLAAKSSERSPTTLHGVKCGCPWRTEGFQYLPEVCPKGIKLSDASY